MGLSESSLVLSSSIVVSRSRMVFSRRSMSASLAASNSSSVWRCAPSSISYLT